MSGELEENVVDIDVQEFTDTERQLILQVVARDEDIRLQEKSRLESLKEDLRNLKERGVPDNEERSYGRVCKRCRTPLGFFFGKGVFCENCSKKVCKQCCIPFEKDEDNNQTWICTVCVKLRDIRAESGAWFYSSSDHKVSKKKVYGSMLMKRIFSIARKRDTVIYKDPVWDDFIKEDAIEEEEENDDYLLVTGLEGRFTFREVPLEEIKPVDSAEYTEEEIFDIEEEDHLDTFIEQEESIESDTESIISEHNEDEEVVQAKVVAGEVMIGLKYDYNDGVFEVQVHRARDLVAADFNKMSADPYVKVYLVSNTRSHGKKKTKAKKNSLHPEFDELLSFKISHEELVTCTCTISVWHYEFSNSNICLGEAEISVSDFCNSGFSLQSPIPQWYTLHSKRINITQLTFSGEIVVNLEYKAPGTLVAYTKREQRKLPNPTKGQLLVNIIKAKDLQADPEYKFYCKMSLVLESETRRMCTKSIPGIVDPYWDEEFLFDNVSWAELEASYLQLTVRGKRHKISVLAGGARLGLGKLKPLNHDSFGKEVEAWQGMLDHPNEAQDFCVPLRSNLNSVKQEEMSVPPKQVKVITDKEYETMKKKDSVTSTTNIAKRFLNADALSLASTGSMLSLYSNAGGQQGNITVTGEILISIKHDLLSENFSVHIEKAKGIAPANKKQTADPYVKVYLLPDKIKTTKKKTMHCRKTLNPVWNETIKYSISHDDLLKKTLQVSIWNHDRFGRNDFLGEVQVNISHYASTNSLDADTPVWYTLQQEMAPVALGGANENKGEMRVSLRFDQDILTVHIKQASGLYAVNPNELPNPFVKCYLLPDKSQRGKRKTTVKKKTITPVWDELFEYRNLEVEDLYSRVLEITVWDHNSSSHQFLGGLRMGLPHGDEYWHDCFGKEVNLWEAMMKHLGILAEYAIPLRATMTSRKGQIQPLLPMITGPDEEDALMSAFSEFPTEGAVMRISLLYCEDAKTDQKKKKKNGCLKVHLKEAKNLPIKPDQDVPSTFCKGFIHPKKKSARMKTDTYIKSANPLWDTEMMFTGLTLDELRTRALEIIVYDVISEKHKEAIGYIRLGSGGNTAEWDDSTGIEVEIWNSMLNNPEQSVMISVPLRLPQEEVLPDEEDPEVSDEYDLDEEHEESVEQTNEGGESPRTSALRAMGVHAANVIDLMNCRDGSLDSSQDNGLVSIGEEDGPPEHKMQTMDPHSLIAEDEIKPGDPPFLGAGIINEEDPDQEYTFKEKKQQATSFSLLKKSNSLESLSSITSTNSNDIYGQVPVRGEIQFGMKYDYSTGIFETHIFQGRDIAAVDTKKEISSPYCKVYLLPDKSKKGKGKTTIRKNTLRPEWEEILEFKISLRDLRTRTLWVSLWHPGKFSRSIFLGEVMLNMDSIIDGTNDLEVSTPIWYALCEKGQAPSTDLFKGVLKFSLMYEDKNLFNSRLSGLKDDEDDLPRKKKKKKTQPKMIINGKINVHIKGGFDLPAADRDGFSDPFCKCYLLPLRSAKSKRKTPIIRHTLNPIWDYKFEYECDYEDLAEVGIEFMVFDWDRGKTNDFLGCTRINLGAMSDNWDDAEGVEVEAWEHLINNPNVWREFSVPLRSKMEPRCKKGLKYS